MRRILGAVIAGGRARRFGSDKALAPLLGRPLIEHVVEALRPHVDALVICGRGYGDLPALSDRPAPDMGPLGGIGAALFHARENGFAGVLTVGCDTPSLPAPLLQRLCEMGGPAYLTSLPVIGYWPAELSESLDHFLAQPRKHAVRAWASEVGAAEIDGPAIANVNEPADLMALERPSGKLV